MPGATCPRSARMRAQIIRSASFQVGMPCGRRNSGGLAAEGHRIMRAVRLSLPDLERGPAAQ